MRSGSSIKQILHDFASENQINPLSLDYNLLSYQTFILKDANEVPIDNDALGAHIDSNNTIIQKYKIEIFRRVSSFYSILIQVQSDEFALALSANIYTQRIPRDGDLAKMIYQIILNICAYRGIIINLGWGDVKGEIAKIATKLRNNDTHPEFYSIDISRLKAPDIHSPANRLLISKNQNNAILSLESPLLSGGFFRIEDGETLLQYHKPRYGSPWRNIYGNLYGIGLSYPIGVGAGDGVEISQKNDCIFYTAQKSGYLSIVNGVMMISQSIIVDNINSKNIINIKEQNIQSLVVKNDALLQDVIPSGFALKVSDLQIIGNVGAVEIESQNLSINGQVHIKSDLRAKKAQILHLKGKLLAEVAEVRHCENAQIECDNLFINQLSGSKIYFTNARVAHIQSNNLLYIQKSLIVKNMLGENNEFMLYPCLYGENKAYLSTLYEKLFFVKKLKNLILADKAQIHSLKSTNELIYENLTRKNHTSFHSWNECITAYKRKNHDISEIYHNFSELLKGIDEKEAEINAQIRKKQDEMFDIEVVFENKTQVGFFVRFINFYGIQQRYFVSATPNNQIKRVGLALGESDGIRIICYKD